LVSAALARQISRSFPEVNDEIRTTFLLALHGVPVSRQRFDEKEYTVWVTVPNSLGDNNKARALYQEYIDQLVYADELGFDGMVLNEHHQKYLRPDAFAEHDRRGAHANTCAEKLSCFAISCRCI